jgi:hypothetical protein
MNTISAVMGSVPTPPPPPPNPPTQNNNSNTSGSSSTAAPSHPSLYQAAAPRSSNIPNTRSTIGVEDEVDFADIPDLMDPTLDSSMENSPRAQSGSIPTGNPIQNLFTAALEHQRQRQERERTGTLINFIVFLNEDVH